MCKLTPKKKKLDEPKATHISISKRLMLITFIQDDKTVKDGV